MMNSENWKMVTKGNTYFSAFSSSVKVSTVCPACVPEMLREETSMLTTVAAASCPNSVEIRKRYIKVNSTDFEMMNHVKLSLTYPKHVRI